MIPLWRPMLCATGAIFVALPLDHYARLLPRRSVVRWPALALTSFVGAYLVFALPMLALITAAGFVTLAVLRARTPSEDVVPRSRAPLGALAAVSSVFLAAMLADRASTPCFWDAFVWLAKARYAAGGLEGLVTGGLHTTLPPFIPSGYPLFEPLSVALLAGFSPRPESVVAGAIGLEILTMLLFLCAIADDERVAPRDRTKRLAAVAVTLLACPLVLVHLRSSYVDLPLGLLVATFAVLLPRRGAGVACAIVAVAAAALKDEGMVHVAAISLVGVYFGLAGKRDDALVRRSIACGSSAALAMAAWHLRLRVNGIANADHALCLPEWQRLGPLARGVVNHLFEFRSWGALGVLGLGGTLAVMVRPRSAPRDAVWFASLLAADAFVLFAALLTTPGRVMEFATDGTLLNRLAMQLTPLAALLIAGWVASPAATHATGEASRSEVAAPAYE